MDVLKSSYYIRCNKYLSFCGHWPYQKSKIQILNQTLLLLAVLTVVGPQFAKMLEIRHSFHNFVLGIPSMCYYAQFILKNLFAFLRRKEIKKALEKIKHDFQFYKDEDLKVLHHCSQEAYKINTFYTVYMFMAVGAYSMLPLTLHVMDVLLPVNGTRLPQKPRLIKYFVHRFDDNIFFIIFHGSVVDIMAIVLIIGFDTLYCSFAYHVCALFIIVTNKMREAIDLKNEHENNESYDDSEKNRDIFYQNFVQTAVRHNFVKTLESAFSSLNLLSIGCAMIPLTITGFEVLLNKSNFGEMFRYILFAVGEIVHLFYYNWPGQKIRDHSLLIYQSCYNCEWYKQGIPDKCKKLLNLMMLRSQKPCCLTAGKVYVLGLENFAAVVKVSMSYFTVLSSIM